MRSLFAFTVSLAAALALPLISADEVGSKALRLLEYNIESGYTKFTLPCPAGSSLGADESLVFELLVQPTTDNSHPDVVLNAHALNLAWYDYTFFSSGLLAVNTTSGVQYTVFYTASAAWDTYALPSPGQENATQHLRIHMTSPDLDITELVFFAYLQPATQPFLRLLGADTVSPGVEGVAIDFQDLRHSFESQKSAAGSSGDDNMSQPNDASFDLAAELESLIVLEFEAEELQAQIVAKKHAISTHLREHRDHVPLRHLLQECDSLVCKARVLAQRICDKVGMLTEPALGYVRVQNSYVQGSTIVHDTDKPSQTSRNCTKSKTFVPDGKMPTKHANGTAHELSVPLTLTKNASAMEYQLRDLVNPPNPLVRALEIVASIIGIAALYSYIRRKCMSMRKRVERAADKEERRNRRAYRKAARRAEMRRQWDNFVNAVSCFRSAPEPRIEDYEEKRALILQDAFLEGLDDLDQAEKGQVMEAEIRELRHAHEIVAGLVRVDGNRYDLVTPVNDPPPPLVPLPYTPETRSRASTGTLPSYTSESLPDYSSRPETLVGSSLGSGSVADGFTNYTPSTSDRGGRRTPMSVSSGGRTRYTPTSSILDISPRASEETMRTRQSKDTQDL
ncbi:hypothetical protein LTR85_007962 [Meristemomyces frigidus]|nr:hypothetical protein LTR85_007962 [Meristemomyces frigidus]